MYYGFHKNIKQHNYDNFFFLTKPAFFTVFLIKLMQP